MKAYSPLDFLAIFVVQIPASKVQVVGYFGYYSNKARCMSKKAAVPDGNAPQILNAKKLTSISWARLIAKVYLDDPLTCPKCKGQMKIIAFIKEDKVITKILRHLGPGEYSVAHAPSPLAIVGHTQKYEEDYSQHNRKNTNMRHADWFCVTGLTCRV